MSPHPPAKLSVLRDIGWREWDPIGLRGLEGNCKGSSAADEYDDYVLRVAARLQEGEDDGPLIDYLVTIETECMGLSLQPGTHSRAVATVLALRDYIRDIS